MTHTLHRTGDRNGLRRDYVILAIESQSSSRQGRNDRFRAFADIVLRHDPVNFGDMIAGNIFNSSVDDIQAGFHDNSIVHAVFTRRDSVVRALRDLKDANIGLSIVVSGLLEETAACCQAAGLTAHTVQYSLGILGNTDLLPRQTVLEITTMCGHGLVPVSLIEKLIDDIRRQEKSVQDAANVLARQCHCGIFNPSRAIEVLTLMLE